ncbi:TPA: hypothetical protein ACGMFC_001179 [Streptococcus agalactiae]
MEKQQLNRVEKITKLNSRYYLVSICGRYYILDYANPKNYKDYLVGLFPERLNSYDIFDVTDDKNIFLKKGKNYKVTTKGATIFLFLYLIHITIFPNNINLAYLTRSEYIYNHISLFLILNIIIFIGILLYLNMTTKEIELSKYESRKLFNSKPRNRKWLTYISSLIISYLALWILAIFGTNYCNLILFGFIFSNCLLLIKFIEFQPSLNGKIYYIK